MRLSFFGCGLVVVAFALAGCGSGGKAEKSLNDQLSEALNNPDPLRKANKLASLSERLGKAEDVTGQDRALEGAVAAANAVADPHMQAGAQIRVAAALHAANRDREARELLDKAHRAAEKIDDPLVKIQVLSDAGKGLAQLPSALDAAKTLWQEALAAADKVEPQDSLANVKALCLIASAAGQFSKEQSVDALDRAKDAAGKVSERGNQVLAWGEIGTTQLRLEQADEATKSLASAKETAAELDDDFQRAGVELEVAKMLATAKHSDLSKEWLTASEASVKKIKSTGDQATIREQIEKQRRKMAER